MRKPCIKLDDEVGKLIGFTSDFFDRGTLWNSLPAGIYVNGLWPIDTKEDEAIEHFLGRVEQLKIRTRFIAPSKTIIKHLKNHGYFYYKDPAGCPNWIKLSEKGIVALCGKLNITPDQLKQQSEDYDCESSH